MQSNRSQARHIDRIASEISGILHAIGEPVPHPLADQDPKTQRRLAKARERQLSERERFLKRYQPAIMAFIQTILKNPDAANAVWDSFVTKWLSGDLRRFDPQKGSFRKYLKTILRNACRQHWSVQARGAHEAPLASAEEIANERQSDAGEAFDRELKESILRRAVHAVAEEEERYYHIVTFMTEAASQASSKRDTKGLQGYLFQQTGREESLANVRQLKNRARACFATKLIEQTGLLIDSALLSDIEEALSDLNLLRFCRAKLAELRT
ncbi:MAG: sigma factor [Planctomycetota bacterium]